MSKTIQAVKEDQSLTKSLQSANRFPWKLYQIVKACKSGAISWDESGRTLLVRPDQFKRECLDPANSIFKTKNLGSFVRQLNLYGFHKLQSSRAEQDDQEPTKPVIYRFRNELFIRGRLDLLHKLHRNVGIRKMKQSCNCNEKENAQESRMNKVSIGSHLPMILPAIYRSWSLSSELKPSTKLTSCIKDNYSPPIFSDNRKPLEAAVKTEPREMLHDSFIRGDLKIASFGSEDDFESKNITMVKKEDFDQIVSVFVEMLRQDPDVRETSLARMDYSISTAVHDLIRRRAQIIRDYEARLKRSVSPGTQAEAMCLPIHDSSFSFSANASRPIFKVADNHMKNAVRMSMVEQSINNQCSCMDFDNYKENLAYI